jgi:hypothetical protein
MTHYYGGAATTTKLDAFSGTREPLGGGAVVQAVLASRGDAADRVESGMFVQGRRGHVDAVGPHDRARLRVDTDAGEVGRVSERLEHPR